jgi:hypothetical protein
MAISNVYLGHIEASDMESTGGNKGKKEFEVRDVLEIFAMPFEQLNHWTRIGYIKPSITKIQGGRVNRTYDLIDIYSVGLFKHLVENTRIPREMAAEFVMTWKKFSRKTHKYVIYDNDYLVFSRTQKEVTVLPFCTKPKITRNEKFSKTCYFSDVSQKQRRISYEEAIIVNYKNIKDFIEARI